MQTFSGEEFIRIQQKGLITIPKKIRQEIGLEEQTLARIKIEKGRLFIEPVRTLPYRVRKYTSADLKDFIDLDKIQTSELKKKKML